jgi:chemotaxis protein methyltransferase CheR
MALEFSDDDFSYVQKIVYDHAGISLADSKKSLVYNRLVKLIRKLKLSGFSEYFEYVEQQGEAEFIQLINSITTNLTSFFRENHHFEFLANELLPDLMKKNASTKRIRIWSAGCSTGEEPYSIAAVVREVIKGPDWDVKILATDLDSNVVKTGKMGVYREDRIEGLPADRVKRWFKRGAGNQDGYVKVHPDLQALITFKQLNLMKDWPITGPLDLIFCRNVVIYFDKETQKVLFDRYAGLLRDQGHLFVGHSETLFKLTDKFKLLGKTIYQKV